MRWRITKDDYDRKLKELVDGKKPMFTLRSPFGTILAVTTQPIGLRTVEAVRARISFNGADFYLLELARS